MTKNDTNSVSVAIVTYNHEKFIAECLESVLCQKLDSFDLEIIVGDDCSTDGTREILKEYNANYPETIKLLLNSKNIGMSENFLSVLIHCTGKYIAILDGDDYWIDSNKLYKQIQFLDDHKNYSGCFHDFLVVDESNNLINLSYETKLKQKTVSLDQLIVTGNNSHTSTRMFRNPYHYPQWFVKWPCDMTLEVLIATSGPWGYLPFVGSHYRIHGEGNYSPKDELAQNLFLEKIEAAITDVLQTSMQRKILNKRKLSRLLRIARLYKQRGETFNYIKYLIQYVTKADKTLKLFKMLIKEDLFRR